MFRPRVIPVLLLKGSSLVKSQAFKKYRYIGDPINAVRIFNEHEADELVFLDILASKEKRSVPLQFVKDVGAEANMPFAVGGGIRSLEQIREIISAGAEKVVINTYAVENPDFISQAARTFGSSTITVCIDAKKKFLSGLKAWTQAGSRASKYTPVELAKLLEERGAGELIIQSIPNDGLMEGYDRQLVREISESVAIPVVALGGAGKLDHLVDCYREGYASGLAAGSLFVYHGPRRGVLINYPDRTELLELFRKDR